MDEANEVMDICAGDLSVVDEDDINDEYDLDETAESLDLDLL